MTFMQRVDRVDDWVRRHGALLVTLFVALALVAGTIAVVFYGDDTSERVAPPAPSTQAAPPADPATKCTDQANVSTERPGVPFEATPDLTCIPCSPRPCYLPFFEQPRLIPGQATNAETQRPEESYGGRPGDRVRVKCQRKGKYLQNDQGFGSNVWDYVEGLGYANDIWLGNTGWHGIRCGDGYG